MERGLAVPDAPERFTFSGIAAYRRELFAGRAGGAFPLKPLLIRAMAAGRCSAEIYRGVWHDVGSVDRLEALNPIGGAP
jgi:MurNAc alpha-1-phosphate uridylyltransferase